MTRTASPSLIERTAAVAQQRAKSPGVVALPQMLRATKRFVPAFGGVADKINAVLSRGANSRLATDEMDFVVATSNIHTVATMTTTTAHERLRAELASDVAGNSSPRAFEGLIAPMIADRIATRRDARSQ